MLSAVTPTASDYIWFSQEFPELAHAYCITLVKEVPPTALLDRLVARERLFLTGIEAVLSEAARLESREASLVRLAAATDVGSWTLLIEPNGYLGVTEEVAGPASAGTTWVSHYHRIGDVDTFQYYVDTEGRMLLDPASSDARLGRTSVEIADALRRMGFAFDDDPMAVDRSAPAAFALAEALTGVRLTPELLAQASFACGIWPPPPA